MALATDRNLAALAEEDALGPGLAAELRDQLAAAKRDTHVLEIGCGEGGVLRDIHAAYPEMVLTGIDIKAPTERGGFRFRQHDMNTPLPDELKGKFDLVFSVATFPYIKDLATALANVAQALKPGGKAIIMFEPFYVGPHGFRMLNKPGVIEWHESKRALLVHAGDGEAIRACFRGYKSVDAPDAVSRLIFEDPVRGQHAELPIEGDVSTLKGMVRRQYPYLRFMGQVVAWEKFLSFVEVNTYNPLGGGRPAESSMHSHRPFKLSAPRFYVPDAVRAADLTRYLTDPSNYDREMLNVAARAALRPAPVRVPAPVPVPVPAPEVKATAAANLNPSQTCLFYTAAVGIAGLAVGALAVYNRFFSEGPKEP